MKERKNGKGLAIFLTIVGVLIGVFFIMVLIQGGFSVASGLGVLLGFGGAFWQIKKLSSNKNEDEYEEEEE